MSVTQIRPAAFLERAGAVCETRSTIIVGVLLFALLLGSTVTVFVQAVWPLPAFEIGVFTLVAAYLLTHLRGDESVAGAGFLSFLVYLIPAWGILQVATHETASTFETRAALLMWASLAGVFFLSEAIACSSRARRAMLSTFLAFATGMAVLCLTQRFTSKGQVLWHFSSGYPEIFATFPSYNNYAQFMELALPIALWRAVREGWRSWWYPLAAGMLFASVIGSASRAGAAICAGELIATPVFSVFATRRLSDNFDRNSRPTRAANRLTRSAATTLVAVPLIALSFTMAVGWDRVLERFGQSDPYVARREFLTAALAMNRQKPVVGFGLGTFPEVYQRYALVDLPFRVNHAHDDWAEFSAEGGVPFLLLFLVPCLAGAAVALQHPWGMGLIGVMLHACVDYPFQRPAVAGWIFLMLALLLRTRDSTKCEPPVHFEKRFA